MGHFDWSVKFTNRQLRIAYDCTRCAWKCHYLEDFASLIIFYVITVHKHIAIEPTTWSSTQVLMSPTRLLTTTWPGNPAPDVYEHIFKINVVG